MSGELDRATAERVLARALEVSGRERHGLSADQLVAIGAELGIAEAHVRHALAEVLAAPPQVRALDATVGAVRQVDHPPALADELLTAWFGADGMRSLRHVGPELAIWEPRTGSIARARAALQRAGGADRDLCEALGITARIEPAGAGALVRLEARVKRDYAVSAAVVAGGGTVAAGFAAWLLAWPAAAGAVVAVGAGVGLLRAQRGESERVALALERRLDLVARGARPPERTSAVDAAFERLRGLRRTVSR